MNEETTVIVQERGSGAAGRFSPGLILGGRYRIVSMLGRGGMGEVYRAEDLRLGQSVALKFLPVELRATDDARERLYREARAGREVTHPNVCRLYDVVEVDQHVFLSMEYVDGEDLASLLRRIGHFSADKALAIVRDVCAGLAAAHEKGVIHADLKPPNIMIDGRGRARISDFGLATLTFDATQSGFVAGTPRYMAPEQFTGARPSVQSDIYALGLLMAEVFTGEAVIQGISLGEIGEKQRAAERFSVRTLVPGLDPRIDDVIRECLRNDPAKRPRSVDDILERLPPRDPLAAAVAAGETPSPGMVAEAGETGEVSRGTALLLLTAALAGLLAIAFLARRTMLYERQPLLPPEVLETRAREILADVAPGLRIADTASWVSIDGRPGEFVVEGASAEATVAENGRLLFHFRSGPEPLVARNTEHRIIDNDPPFDVSGMTRVVLDGRGNIVEFAVVPPKREAAKRSEPDWTPLLGVDSERLPEVQTEWAAPVDTDVKRAWRAGNTHIEAGSYHGRPVWFFVAGQPGEVVPRDALALVMTRTAGAFKVFFVMAIPLLAVPLAIRNLRRGHVDLRGATKAALFVGITSLITAFLRADHSTSLRDEWIAFSLMLIYSSFWGAVVWLDYVAVEPLVRRRWPRMMIGWTRLLAGRWRDPMIGREVLAGACAAIAILIAWHCSVLIPDLLGQEVNPLVYAVTTLGRASQVACYMTRALGEAILSAIGAAVVLLVFRVIVRNPAISGTLTVIVLMLSFLAETSAPPLFRAAYALLAGCVVLFLLTRFGVVSVGVFAGVIIVIRTLPVTLDVSKWYFARGSLALAAVVALVIFGFIVSLGAKSILPAGMFEVDERAS